MHTLDVGGQYCEPAEAAYNVASRKLEIEGDAHVASPLEFANSHVQFRTNLNI